MLLKAPKYDTYALQGKVVIIISYINVKQRKYDGIQGKGIW